MAAATPAQLRAGLKANIDVAFDGQVSAYMLAQPTAPAAHIYPADIEYDLALNRGLDRWTFTVQAIVQLSTDIGSQKVLDAYIASSGAKSLKAAIESDQTLAGALTINPGERPVRVTECTGYRVIVPVSGGPVLGCDWTVEIWQPGT